MLRWFNRDVSHVGESRVGKLKRTWEDHIEMGLKKIWPTNADVVAAWVHLEGEKFLSHL
jgi:hypothetical protein